MSIVAQMSGFVNSNNAFVIDLAINFYIVRCLEQDKELSVFRIYKTNVICYNLDCAGA